MIATWAETYIEIEEILFREYKTFQKHILLALLHVRRRVSDIRQYPARSKIILQHNELWILFNIHRTCLC